MGPWVWDSWVLQAPHPPCCYQLPGFSWAREGTRVWDAPLPPPTALPLPSHPQEAYCAYAIILMALFWCTEALPLAVTAFFPIILFPMMGILDASEVSSTHPSLGGRDPMERVWVSLEPW